MVEDSIADTKIDDSLTTVEDNKVELAVFIAVSEVIDDVVEAKDPHSLLFQHSLRALFKDYQMLEEVIGK